MPNPTQLEMFAQCTRCRAEKLRREELVDVAEPGAPEKLVCMTCIDNADCPECRKGV